MTGSLYLKFMKKTPMEKAKHVTEIYRNLFFHDFISSLQRYTRIIPAGNPSKRIII